MSLPKITRSRTFSERHVVWLLLFVLLAAPMLGYAFYLIEGKQLLRGYTPLGYGLGVLAVVLSLIVALYSARKRRLQEKMPAAMRSTMVTWLWAHVYAGLLALVAASVHAGFALVSDNWSSGKLLYWVFAVLILSGVLWRLVYRAVPPKASGEIRNYSTGISTEYAQKRVVEIEKVAAGKSAVFQSLKKEIINGNLNAAETMRNQVPSEELDALTQLIQLADSRQRAEARSVKQKSYTRLLQGWKWAHIPLSFGFLLLLLFHIVEVTDAVQQVAPAQLNGFPSANECADCHQTAVDQWRDSMHAHAVTSPVTIVQTNQVAFDTLAGVDHPDPALLCNNCHAPVSVMITEQATLPFEATQNMSAEHMNEGVTCAVCHQFTDEPVTSGASYSAFWDGLEAGRVQFGAVEDTVGNAFHQSGVTTSYANSDQLCMSCHNVNYDRDGDGVITKGVDLVLQTTFEEQERFGDGEETCVSCHMPVMEGVTRMAESADIPSQQDYDAPDRVVHDHGFVGVDYPLDTVSKRDPQRAAREELLQSAALMELINVQVTDNQLTFDVEITNDNLGHQLPTGFAFARQMWVEIVVTDSTGATLFTSGVVNDVVEDLCDADTMNDALVDFMIHNCPNNLPDPQLLNFQQKLLDEIDILRDEDGEPILNEFEEFILAQGETGEETWLQHVTSGAVARKRPVDNRPLNRLIPNEPESFAYTIPIDSSGNVTIAARLRFRNLPPYFLRVLGESQPDGDLPQILPIIKNLQIVDMVSATATIQP